MSSFFHLRHLQDLRLIVLILVSLVLIGFHLNQAGGGAGEAGASWRKLDIEALQRRIETGDLSDREADWYRQLGSDRAERHRPNKR